MREKLIELLMNCEDIVRSWDGTYEEAADNLIANGVTVQKWIPVTERLPEKWQDIIAYDAKNQEIHIAYMTEDEWVGVRMNGKVTHWMPLPQPPEGE